MPFMRSQVACSSEAGCRGLLALALGDPEDASAAREHQGGQHHSRHLPGEGAGEPDGERSEKGRGAHVARHLPAAGAALVLQAGGDGHQPVERGVRRGRGGLQGGEQQRVEPQVL